MSDIVAKSVSSGVMGRSVSSGLVSSDDTSTVVNYLSNTLALTDVNTDGVPDGWLNVGGPLAGTPTFSLIDVSSSFNVVSSVNSQRVQYTGVVGDSSNSYHRAAPNTANGSFVQHDNVACSIFIKGTIDSSITFRIELVVLNAASGILETFAGELRVASSINASQFQRIDDIFQITQADSSKVQFKVAFLGIDDTETMDFQLALPQVEKSPVIHRFIEGS